MAKKPEGVTPEDEKTTGQQSDESQAQAGQTAPKDEKPVKKSSSKKKDAAEKLVDVAELGKELPVWKLTGILTMKQWKPGKQVSEAEFQAAVEQFENRSIGRGR
ncbi:MAG: hypothetical protein AB7E76_02830 [Deferribacterales bacterium]